VNYLPPRAPQRRNGTHPPELELEPAETDGIPVATHYAPSLGLIAGMLIVLTIAVLGVWKLVELVTRAL
jgi:hypothetical protein